MRDETLKWLAMLVWATTQNIADALQVHRTTALRWLARLQNEGFARFRVVGQPPTKTHIWLLTSEGDWRLFPHEHMHPGPGDGHIHDPGSEEVETHFHPSYWHSEQGARELFTLLEMKRQFYPLAINLFKGDGRLWHPEQAEARLLSFRWLRKGGLIQAVGEYEGNLIIFFHWISLELSDAMLRGRWRRRFEGLTLRVEADWEPVEFDSPPERNLPRWSGNVLLVEDVGAFSVALRNLGIMADGQPCPWLVVCSADSGLRHQVGVVRPTGDNIWDPHADVDVGLPENLCPDPSLEDDDKENHNGE